MEMTIGRPLESHLLIGTSEVLLEKQRRKKKDRTERSMGRKGSEKFVLCPRNFVLQAGFIHAID